uniref:Uncharacterized protein n=1 Tax=Dulem virus 90 TaxID=3145801 RepID=A0AAU8B059_9VIRU
MKDLFYFVAALALFFWLVVPGCALIVGMAVK